MSTKTCPRHYPQRARPSGADVQAKPMARVVFHSWQVVPAGFPNGERYGEGYGVRTYKFISANIPAECLPISVPAAGSIVTIRSLKGGGYDVQIEGDKFTQLQELILEAYARRDLTGTMDLLLQAQVELRQIQLAQMTMADGLVPG